MIVKSHELLSHKLQLEVIITKELGVGSKISFMFTHTWESDLILTNIFQMGWFNHQLETQPAFPVRS